MKIKVLGSGGWIPTKSRHTSAFIIQNKNQILFLDMGTGIANFEMYRDILQNTDEINIILSHYHIDHIVGFCYLLNICENKKINIWGPGTDFYNKKSEDILSLIFSEPYFGKNIKNFTDNVTIRDFQLGKNTLNNDFSVEIFAQKHSAPSFAFYINNMVFYATDTTVLEEHFKIAQNAKLFLHECWEIKKNNASNSSHSNLEEIILYANKHGIEKTGLIHINPNWTKKELEELENIIAKENIFLVQDGDEYTLAMTKA